MKFKLITFILINIIIFPMQTYAQTTPKIEMTLDAASIIHEMKGGIGASWHALIHEIPLENEKYDYPVRMINPRGSAYAGNPPLQDTGAWDQLYQHASWLGLNFIRVELSQYMYEPERRVFDWDNEEMEALYRILDWCEANQADVFLQQMWGHVGWNAFDNVHPLLSSPKSLDDFTHGISTLIKHLTETKGYTCIKYFCMINEPPGGPWGYWWNSGSHEGPTVAEAWQKLHETFQAEGINIPISGPDWVSLPPLQPEKMVFEPYLGALDIHSYFGIYHLQGAEAKIRDWVKYAESKGKPFFISELGNMSLGWGKDDPGPKSFEAALSNASDVALCMNIGVDGFNRWSFTNRGDMDGQWQLVKTFDLSTRQYVGNITPEPEAYFGFAMLSRFMGKYPTVLSLQQDQLPGGVVATAFRNKNGSIGILLVNNLDNSLQIDLNILNHTSPDVFYHYYIDQQLLQQPDFELSPILSFRNSKKIKNVVIPAKSIHMLTTANLMPADNGFVQ